MSLINFIDHLNTFIKQIKILCPDDQDICILEKVIRINSVQAMEQFILHILPHKKQIYNSPVYTGYCNLGDLLS